MAGKWITSVTHPYLTQPVIERYMRLSGFGNVVVEPSDLGGYDVRFKSGAWFVNTQARCDEERAIVYAKRYLTELAERRLHTPTVGELGYW